MVGKIISKKIQIVNEETRKFFRDIPLRFAKHLTFTKNIFTDNVSDFYKYFLTPETYIQ